MKQKEVILVEKLIKLCQKDVLYQNVTIREVISDEAGGVLTLRADGSDGKAWNIIYRDMYYSQLNEGSVGVFISRAKEISFWEFFQPRHHETLLRMLADCGADLGFLQELEKRGNRLFANYAGRSEYLIVAKEIFTRRQLRREENERG